LFTAGAGLAMKPIRGHGHRTEDVARFRTRDPCPAEPGGSLRWTPEQKKILSVTRLTLASGLLI